MLTIAPKLSVVLAAGILSASFAHSPLVRAFDFGNMMNPSKWMGSDRDRYDYDDGPYRGGPWGGPYRGPWGGPWGGYGPGPYGGGPYGAPGYPGTLPPASAAPTAPARRAPSPPAASSSEIDELKRRIEELESQQQPASPPPSDWESAPAPAPAPPPDDWSSAPAFRPMGKY